jgi:hypothetical protein
MTNTFLYVFIDINTYKGNKPKGQPAVYGQRLTVDSC